MKIYSAPLQGFTEAVWRNIHETVFGGIDGYFGFKFVKKCTTNWFRIQLDDILTAIFVFYHIAAARKYKYCR